ncbi:MAG TPA: primosomal replication protein N [Burkholderiales bacterium]|nr:primosomal replication protein N [Burkholderiales bacterium]
MSGNAVTLTGEIVGTEPLRHTPAGIPIIQFTLAHRSQQIEAGFRRQVECEVRCVALGDPATELSRAQAPAKASVTGFLSRKHRMSAQLVLHATKIDLLKENEHGNDE